MVNIFILSDNLFYLAMEYYNKAQKNANINNILYGQKYKKKYLSTALEYVNLAYRKKKEIEILLLKSKIEYELKLSEYFDTMIELIEHYQSLNYKDYIIINCKINAVVYIIDLDMNKINTKMVNMVYEILNKYNHLISFNHMISLYNKMIEYHFINNEYSGGYLFCKGITDNLIIKNQPYHMVNLFYLKRILSAIANNNYEKANKDFKRICTKSYYFNNSNIAFFISEIFYSINDSNLTNYECAINKFIERNEIEYYILSTLNYVKNIYFIS